MVKIISGINLLASAAQSLANIGRDVKLNIPHTNNESISHAFEQCKLQLGCAIQSRHQGLPREGSARPHICNPELGSKETWSWQDPAPWERRLERTTRREGDKPEGLQQQLRSWTGLAQPGEAGSLR